jgi:hypothetical protein
MENFWETIQMITMARTTFTRYAVACSQHHLIAIVLPQEYDYARSVSKSSFSHYMWLGAIFIATNFCKCRPCSAAAYSLTFYFVSFPVIIMMVIAWKSNKSKGAKAT